jgi:hypothetical protein
LWLDLWLFGLITYIGLAGFGMVMGDPGKIGKPMDPDRNLFY